jgi:uncharacterized membrane protein
MQERQMITLEDAAVVSWPQGKKRSLIPQGHEMTGYGALGGAFWGFLFGLIFFVPFLGAAPGAGAGAALLGSLDKGGIDEEFISEVGEVTEGRSALFVLTSGAPDREKVVAELKQYNFEIIWTNLPEEQLQQLREVFAS